MPQPSFSVEESLTPFLFRLTSSPESLSSLSSRYVCF
jgi:hypothetical protein